MYRYFISNNPLSISMLLGQGILIIGISKVSVMTVVWPLTESVPKLLCPDSVKGPTNVLFLIRLKYSGKRLVIYNV